MKLLFVGEERGEVGLRLFYFLKAVQVAVPGEQALLAVERPLDRLLAF